jgi:hypothetical protein
MCCLNDCLNDAVCTVRAWDEILVKSWKYNLVFAQVDYYDLGPVDEKIYASMLQLMHNHICWASNIIFGPTTILQRRIFPLTKH